MYKNLYDQFAHWFHGGRGTVYFYSDPHFNDDEMKYLRKNYIGDEEQVKRINSKIGKYDTIVFLGDIGDIEFIRKIRGYKVLIMGNHDKGASNYKRRVVDALPKDTFDSLECEMHWHHYFKNGIEWYDNCLFDEVYEGPLFIAPNILLSHEPVEFPYAKNIHGHTHSTPDKLNMCAEHIDYTPVQLKWLVENGMLKAPDIHREAIDNAIERKAKLK